MIIAHNMMAINANRQLNMVNKSRSKTTEKLSSGYRINRAADDAAGLAISEKMRRQIRGLSQGVRNTQDGVSMCQVADGALTEVNDMLHRITELSVKAANGTNTEEDREYIQKEINEILLEIDRIGDTTTFNEKQIFTGSERVLQGADGSSIIEGDIPFQDFKLANINLGTNPFQEGDGANHLGLQAVVDNTSSAAHGKTYNLIYGSGSTSSSMVRIDFKDGTEQVYNLSTLSIQNNTYDAATNTWSREFVLEDTDKGINLVIRQNIGTEETSSDEKNYKISYEIEAQAGSRTDIGVGLFLHADTAYNNNDYCEGYFIDGQRVNTTDFYKSDSSLMDSYSEWGQGSHPAVPDSFSIVDVDNALAFSEKISFAGGDKPTAMIIGHYNKIKSYSDIINNQDNFSGESTQNLDLGFTLYYEAENLDVDKTFSYNYGIIAVEEDVNIKNTPIQKNDNVTTVHEGMQSVWIQSGAESGQGMFVTIDEMNTSVLGIRAVDVTTVEGANEALGAVKGALRKVSENRSKIGAQQNRLEHTIANEENVVENTTAAESRIRDADMATEMVKYSRDSILEQVGQSMLAQSNQSNQGVLSLLQ